NHNEAEVLFQEKFKVDENGVLYLSAVVKDDIVKYERHYVVSSYDSKLRDLLLDHFHDQANHHCYYKTFTALSEKHVSITQQNVQDYINQCSTCIINCSIKEKTDIKPVVSMMAWHYIQIDLIDFQDFAKVNYGFAWLLICIYFFFKYLVAVPMKNKENDTIAMHLIKD
ncbi:1960_t:CDS:2, partial [Cetraspora pellucida]